MLVLKSLWRSFRARLVIGSVIWIVGGVALSGVVLAEIFREHVTDRFDAELDGHAQELAALAEIDPRGHPQIARRLSDPRFQPLHSGFYWQIEGDDQTLPSDSLGLARLRLNTPPPSPGARRHGVAEGPTGQVRVVEQTIRPVHATAPWRISVAGDQQLLDDLLAEFNRTLALSLGVIAAGLVTAAVLSLHFGLAPMRGLRRALMDLRSGKSTRLAVNTATEITPLVEDLNALFDLKEEMLQRARLQAGNLAHALKTPLAILSDEGERLHQAGQIAAAEIILLQCERMRQQIDYQLARARAAASRGSPGLAVDIDRALVPVIQAMERIHGHRGVQFTHVGLTTSLAAIDSRDFSEIVANLLDNAGKWAASQVLINTSDSDGWIRILIDDDGPGLPPQARESVFELGARLDERAPGSGLGLAIVLELATLYGGYVTLDGAPSGGLRATLLLRQTPTAGYSSGY